jgi:L-amino acid N-acyltransferase YncA
VTVAHEPIPPGGFPKALTLEDGTAVVIRPLEAGDEAALLDFFNTVPEDERYWLREDVSDPAVVHRWVTELNYERVLPLIADRDGTIIADGTLHRRGFGARQWLGELRLVVSPAYRGRGLGYTMIAELMEIAQATGIERLEAEIVSGAQAAAVEAIEQLGFQQVARIPAHLRGPHDEPHDLALFVYQLREDA